MIEEFEELRERLAEARAGLREAREQVVGLDAEIQQIDNRLQTAKSVGERATADLDRKIEFAHEQGDPAVRQLQEEAATRHTELTRQLNDLEVELERLRAERIAAAAQQTARELDVQELTARLNGLENRVEPRAQTLQQADALQAKLAEIEGQRDEMAKQIEEYAPLVEAQRSAAGDSAAKDLAISYLARVESHSTDWKKWLRRLVFLGIVALVGGVAVVIVAHPPDDATNAQIVSSLAIDLLVLGLLLYAVRFAAHQFSVHRHLEAVAQAKTDALNTYTRIGAVASDPETRSAVSVALAQAVFQADAGGFIDTSNENITLIERVLAPAAQRASA